jgi:glycosyltransferase involved in cell wall biosynthesis
MSVGPDVSVVTTLYNGAAFIADTVASIAAQRGVTCEHIVVDDGSTDGGAEAAARMAGVRLIMAGRVGRGVALNIGVAAATAPFIAIQDADDLSHPERLATELAVLRSRAEFAAVGTGQVLVGRRGRPTWRQVEGGVDVADVTPHLPFYNPLSHTSVMFRREALDAVGGYDQTRRAMFDWDVYVRLAASGCRLGKLAVPLVAKRVHADQYFEGRHPRLYALRQLEVQWRALPATGRSRLLSVTFPAMLLYRWLPRRLRLLTRRQINKARDAGEPTLDSE